MNKTKVLIQNKTKQKQNNNKKKPQQQQQQQQQKKKKKSLFLLLVAEVPGICKVYVRNGSDETVSLAEINSLSHPATVYSLSSDFWQGYQYVSH